MSSLDRHFEKFHKLIALDQGRIDRIKSAHTRLRDNVEADGPLSKLLKGVFLQGSYAQSTAIRPADHTEFDVDVVLALDASERDFLGIASRRAPEVVIDHVANRLRNCREYEGKVRRRGRCVRITYASEFHMDVVPAHAPDGGERGVDVPDATSASWIASHPKGYLEWGTTQNRETEGRFTRIVKYLKWWRDNRLPLSARPKSIVLQTLIGKRMPRRSGSDAQALVGTLESMGQLFGPNRFFFSAPTVTNPSRPDEDLASAWGDDAAFAFGEQLRRATTHATTALQEPREDKSAQLWQQVLGDRFPLTA